MVMLIVGLAFIIAHLFYYKNIKSFVIPYLNGKGGRTKDPNDMNGAMLMAGFAVSIVTFLISISLFIVGTLQIILS